MSENDRKGPIETVAEWLRFAEENLAVAEREMAYEDPSFHTVCFLCQTAAEKYLRISDCPGLVTGKDT
jgi:HEPN domain-containing protein